MAGRSDQGRAGRARDDADRGDSAAYNRVPRSDWPSSCEPATMTATESPRAPQCLGEVQGADPSQRVERLQLPVRAFCPGWGPACRASVRDPH